MKYSNEVKVGLALVAAIVVFYVGVRYFQNIPLFRGSYELYTEFRDAGGLVSGNPVQINGVGVGRVETVKLADDGRNVVVRFQVDEDVTVPEGSQAKVSGVSALSGVKLAIDLGPPSNPPLEPGARVLSPPATDVLARLSEQAPALASKADSVLAGADDVLSSLAVQLGDSTSDLRRTLRAARGTARQTERLMAENRASLRGTLANLEALTADVQRLAARNDSLDLNGTNARAQAALERLEATLANLERTTATLDVFLERINAGEGTLGRLATDPSLYNNLDSTAVRLNRLMDDFQRDPSRYLDGMTLVKVF